MNILIVFLLGTMLLRGAPAFGAVQIVVDHNRPDEAAAAFTFEHVPPPSRNDAATAATFTLVAGQCDPNGGGLEQLHDGKLPPTEDAPGANFFFAAGTPGGRLVVDLGRSIAIQQVNTYSWHSAARAPQVYRLYASDGSAAGFNAGPKTGTDPLACGWKFVAAIDTRPALGERGGQYGVSITDTAGALGCCRYLLFAIACTETSDPFGNTFYSEIDVLERGSPAPEPVQTVSTICRRTDFTTADGKSRLTIDTSETPDLTGWAEHELAPVLQEWYPKIVALLPGDGDEAPRRINIVFRRDMDGVASTSGTRVQCAAHWFRQNLHGEAKGSLIHELVHVVQRYDHARQANRQALTPGWLVEGIADYVRWFKFEPQSHGADIAARGAQQARYDASYRVSANFLNWVSGKYGHDIVAKVNAALRAGRYDEKLWQEFTGQTVQDLGAEWQTSLLTK